MALVISSPHMETYWCPFRKIKCEEWHRLSADGWKWQWLTCPVSLCSADGFAFDSGCQFISEGWRTRFLNVMQHSIYFLPHVWLISSRDNNAIAKKHLLNYASKVVTGLLLCRHPRHPCLNLQICLNPPPLLHHPRNSTWMTSGWGVGGNSQNPIGVLFKSLMYFVASKSTYLCNIILTFILLIKIVIWMLMEKQIEENVCYLQKLKKALNIAVEGKKKLSYNTLFSIVTFNFSVAVHWHFWTEHYMSEEVKTYKVQATGQNTISISPSLERSPSPTSSCSRKAWEPIRYGSGLST